MDVSHSVWYHIVVELDSGILYKQKFCDLRQAFTKFLRSEENVPINIVVRNVVLNNIVPTDGIRIGYYNKF